MICTNCLDKGSTFEFGFIVTCSCRREKKDLSMQLIQTEILNCLRMFGPSSITEIETKLKSRRVMVSNSILTTALQNLVRNNLIERAQGYETPTFKLKDV